MPVIHTLTAQCMCHVTAYYVTFLCVQVTQTVSVVAAQNSHSVYS